MKKSCTLCGFNHNEAETRCETAKVVEEEFREDQDGLGEAVGGELPPDPMSTRAEPVRASVNHVPDQAALNELASLENRMNSRMEKFESVIVNLVSGLSLPSQNAASAEKKTTATTVIANPKPAKPARDSMPGVGRILQTLMPKLRLQQARRRRNRRGGFATRTSYRGVSL